MTPQLGFGTAPIMGRVSRRQGLRALEQAYSLGVRHFDTARSYGWGEAEGVLGTFLRDKPREALRIVTKCGIFPARRSPLLSAAKSTARAMLALAPALHDRVRRAASFSAFQPTHVQDPSALQASLQTSLNELGVGYVDTLLLHNFAPNNSGLDEVVEWFAELKRKGTVRRYGFSIEGDLHAGLAFLAGKGWLAGSIVQAPVGPALLSLPAEWRQVSIVAHAPFAFLREQAERGGKIRTLADLRQALAQSCRCEAVVCSMFSPAHLRANVAAWSVTH